jgi:hypothetical protein
LVLPALELAAEAAALVLLFYRILQTSELKRRGLLPITKPFSFPSYFTSFPVTHETVFTQQFLLHKSP